MKRITVITGREYDRHGKRIETEEWALAKVVIVKLLSSLFGGITVYDSVGAWKDNSGQLVAEQGWTFVAIAETSQHALIAAEHVRDSLNQQSVVLTVEDVESSLI